MTALQKLRHFVNPRHWLAQCAAMLVALASTAAPASGAVFSIPASITLSASASDADGTVTRVDYYQGSTLIGSATTAPYTATWTAMQAGSYAITARAVDNYGASGTSAAAVITLGGGITFLHHDLAGNPITATDTAGNVLWRENFRPFGDRLNNQAAASGNRQWFHGKAVDADTGLSYFGARYYDPALGRFMGVDAVGFDEGNLHSFNKYLYGNGNPYKYTDPDGNAVVLLIPVAIAAARIVATRVAYSRAAAIATELAGEGVVAVGGAVAGAKVVGKAADAAQAAAKEINLSRSIHGEAAVHAADAIQAGKPSLLTIDRGGAASNRRASTGALDKVPGKHLDEYPPAMFREGGTGASVRPVSPRDNMSSGACIGNACRGLPDGTQVQIKIGD